jgi:hypothetical protein
MGAASSTKSENHAALAAAMIIQAVVRRRIARRRLSARRAVVTQAKDWWKDELLKEADKLHAEADAARAREALKRARDAQIATMKKNISQKGYYITKSTQVNFRHEPFDYYICVLINHDII